MKNVVEVKKFNLFQRDSMLIRKLSH